MRYPVDRAESAFTGIGVNSTPAGVDRGAGITGRSKFANQPHALRLENVSLSFGGVKALTSINLNVSQGEIRAIIGPNGAGKSSLLNVISGIYQPDQGHIWIGHASYRQVPVNRLARLGITRTFQNLALFKGLSVLENIEIARVSVQRATFIEQLVGWGRAGREAREARARAEAIINFFDLAAVQNRLIGTLSYGVQKRVELARALVLRPKILLLDEPMAGMTSTEKLDMVRFVRAARAEFGTTVILIEHDIGVVMGLSDQITVLDYGRKIADGTPEEIRNNPEVINAYTGTAHDGETLEENL